MKTQKLNDWPKNAMYPLVLEKQKSSSGRNQSLQNNPEHCTIAPNGNLAVLLQNLWNIGEIIANHVRWRWF